MAPLFKLYIENVRPTVAKRAPKATDSIFICSDGKPDTRLGEKVTKFFRRWFNKQYSSTMIRAVIETRAEDLKEQNWITVSL